MSEKGEVRTCQVPYTGSNILCQVPQATPLQPILQTSLKVKSVLSALVQWSRVNSILPYMFAVHLIKCIKLM